MPLWTVKLLFTKCRHEYAKVPLIYYQSPFTAFREDAENGGDETSVYESMSNSQQNAAAAHPLDRSVFSISAFHSYLKKGSSLSVRLEKLNVGGTFPFRQDYLAVYKDVVRIFWPRMFCLIN